MTVCTFIRNIHLDMYGKCYSHLGCEDPFSAAEKVQTEQNGRSRGSRAAGRGPDE